MSPVHLLPLRALACARRLAPRLGSVLAVLALGGNVALAASARSAPTASAPPFASQAVTAEAPASAQPQTATGSGDTYIYRIPLLRQNAVQGLTLLGEDAYGGMDFGLRRDERVVGARLVLDYRYSPTLLPALSHLNVLLNGVVGATIALPEPVPRTSTQVSVDLPVSLLGEFNHLNLELIAHSKASDQGNDPLSPDLWLKAGPNSALELTVAPAAVSSDLSQLPAPFVDARDERRVNLPVVLPRAPGERRLESAGIVASWLGAQAGYRGSHFTASLGALPAHGHAVVLALRDELPSLGLAPLAVDAPTLAIVPNPNDPNGKLLLVAGRDEPQLRTAALALVLGAKTLAGPQVRIDGPVAAAPRQPFDAPNWLPGDRPVALGELLPADRFTIQGLRPGAIDVDLRLPPGLFGFNNSGAVLNLRYRYTARPESTRSALNVLAGNTPIATLPLPGDASDGHAVMRIPTYLLPPLTTLQFDYRYEPVKTKDHWQDVPGGPLLSAIDPTSTIDISQLPRYTAMPDLGAFANAGFPFTRLADLSETAVILPTQPAADDDSAYLTLMGSMGQATGYPVLGVTVADPAQVESLRQKDLLVLASGDNQPLLKAWRSDLPRGFFAPAPSSGNGLAGWWDKLTGGQTQARREADIAALYRSDDHDGMVAGFESPLAHGRSVVVVSGNTPGGLSAVADALQARHYRVDDTIGGSLVVVNDGILTTLNKDQSYFIGSLPLRLAIEWFFASHIVLLLAATLVSVVLIGLLGGVLLHRRALRRLNLDIPQTSQREEGRRGSHV
ncbi:cellulose biosynthesis cyclic di-GMP-binding regulatory protein BcsB [Paraburkholderia sp. CNPSo 3281]|uniref:cellulose biosynthesis cyclic di-GMP-binding regulatory protein BcsB n=1 Tax=Paraburkholderia sp. CNPSo 3281 TaxID=2940933 RepID=UPI0020B82F04|nr:cellulose biosynthesis cyclic di-GMP-binding regulatory protein BcsB [Paraburkholderia sp. CNPSo 3281]MCP3716637.1 cellulose biosynthesis cyclic di-GMP-binding regulatory protein BcsB [Paraburkholderia sp. CNPSo 3281]